MGVESPKERVSKYNLTQGADQYASQVSQNPDTARVLKSLIPSQAGFLERQQPTGQKFGSNTLPGRIGWLFEFDQSNGTVITRFFFAVAKLPVSGYALYLYNAGVWSPVAAVDPLANYPTAVVIDNNMHLSDGVTAWIFDGVTWKVDGLEIPSAAPVFNIAAPPAPKTILAISRTNGVTSITVASKFTIIAQYLTIAGVSADPSFNIVGAQIINEQTVGPNFQYQVAQPGLPDSTPAVSGTLAVTSFSVQTNRFYWTTFVDASATDGTEGSSSPKSLGTGAFTNEIVSLYARAGSSVTVTLGSQNVSGVGTDFNQGDVGMTFFTFLGPAGVIQSVTDSQHLTLKANSPYGITTGAGNFLIAPARTTNINFYCSEAEDSEVGFLLATAPIVGNGNPLLIDQSPFVGTAGSYISIVLERPIRNDPPDPTLISTVHKRRIFRRNEKFPNIINYSAYEEVLSTGVGDPTQCVPGEAGEAGGNVETISDIVDDFTYPDQSTRITGICSYADSLFIGSERNVIPLFGESIDDFVLSEITAFSVGVAGRYCIIGLPQGLCFLSYDQKIYLWPSQWVPFYAPEETTQLVELSRPIRNNIALILGSDIDNVHFVWYNFGKRNWLVTTYQDQTNNYHTWVFDFEIKGWFELQPGFASVAVFETQFGYKSLIGGGTDGNVYVIDDQTGTFPFTGLNFPQGTYRPALIDFGSPDNMHNLKYVEYETDNVNLSVMVNYYLDPINVDSPGSPNGTIIMSRQKLGANRFRGGFVGPAACERVLLEFIVASDQNQGVLRSITLAATPVSKMANTPAVS